MIDSKELRLGNYFIEENSKEIIEVIGLEKNRVVFSGMFLEKWQAKNIEITEDWLIKFGFEKKDRIWSDKSVSENLFFKKNYFLELSTEGILFCQLHSSGNSWFLKNIKSIHQLQNLYYALTGEELTIKRLI